MVAEAHEVKGWSVPMLILTTSEDTECKIRGIQ